MMLHISDIDVNQTQINIQYVIKHLIVKINQKLVKYKLETCGENSSMLSIIDKIDIIK